MPVRTAIVAAAILLTAVVAGAQPPATGTQAPPPAQAPVQAQPPAVPDVRSEILEQILVKVNGDILTKTDLEARQITALRQRSQQMNDEELRKAIAEVTPELLADAIDEMLLLQRGKELGYKVTDEQFARVLESIRKENKLEDEEQFKAALKQEGLDVATLRKNIERSMVINQVQQVEVLSRISITEDEARLYYNTHQGEFTTPAQITLRELSISVPTDGKTVNVGLDEDTKRRAEAALARARKGEAFEALVTELSDSPSKANGGLVGPLNETELDPAIRKMLETMKAGDVTEVFRTRGGWAILKLETATKSEIKTYEAARDQIADKVAGTKRRAEFLRYIQKLRGQAIIDWKNAEMKKLWEERLTADVQAPAK
jgi:parvulin-like peptidyl-prolyl isomerase